MYSLFGQVVEILLAFARLKAHATRHRLARSRLDLVLEEHIHEHVHGFGLDHQCARWFERIRVEVLVHAVVMYDGNIASLPVIAHAIVNLIADAIKNIKAASLT